MSQRHKLPSVFIILSVLIGMCICFGNVSASENITVINPYRDVDWTTFGQYKANFHTHTNQSDGAYDPSFVVFLYEDAGYSILAITDHNKVTWPWEDYRIDIEDSGILPIMGNELSSHHHVVSLFNDYLGQYSMINMSLFEVQRRGGLAIIAHPAWSRTPTYTPEWYARLYEAFDCLIGQEVYNTCTIVRRDTLEYDVEMWDKVLALTMPDRPVWGIANDDMHNSGDLYQSWNVLLLDELTEEKVKEALQKGQFYISYCEFSFTIVKPSSPPTYHSAPTLNSIEVDEEKGTITIDAGDYEQIVWRSDNGVIYIGDTLDYRNTEGIGSYIRADIIGKYGITSTQPFAVKR